MAFDRETTLKKAEKLLRQGRLEPAIAEYLRVAQADPADWMTANTLGDLYVRAGQPQKAAGQYKTVADHFIAEGFYSKAAAILKKLLKLNPNDEAVQLQLADMAQRQGLLADAKAYLNAVAARRRARGDRAGVADIVLRLGDVDPNDFDLRRAAAEMRAEMGDDDAAAAAFRGIYDDLVEKKRLPEAVEALRRAVQLNPHDQEGRVILARTAIQRGDMAGAREFLDRESAGEDPALLSELIDVELENGRVDEVRDLLPALLAHGSDWREKGLVFAWRAVDISGEEAYPLVEAIVDAMAAGGEFDRARKILDEFVTRVPDHVRALVKQVEICVDGGLEPAMNEAQARLTDAYLAAGRAEEARVTAEDLVAREPWERAHLERYRRALVMLKVPQPDMLIAERLGGESPFVATDVFAPAPEPFAQPTAKVTSATSAMSAVSAAPPAEPRRAGVPGGIPVSRFVDPPEPVTSPDAAQAPLAAAFQNVRKQVTEASGSDQAAQHMTLARTYLDMGMTDQALVSLTEASRSLQFRFEAASLIGRIHMDRGELPEAADWLGRASEAPSPTIEDGRSVLYDLARVIEQTGDTARSLAIYMELQSEAGDYRDVAERVARLAHVETETES